ncbi:MAG: SEC59/DGK1/VTE5 family protein [Candidatus Poribacteria bacterium]|nr:SEC59/DGK1/VTE5 family protein [Candidatus Poribacteria bacterium]
MLGELLRKSIHLAGLILPVIYFFLDKPMMLIVMGVLTGIAVTVELVKWFSPDFGKFFFQIFAPMLRRHERRGAMTGATYYMISAFLCVLFFSKTLAIVCIFFMVLGDLAAALVGRMWGKTKLLGTKSLEGSIACFVVCAAIALVQLHPIIGIIGALVATIVEMMPFPIDDNLTVPLVSGAVMHFLMHGPLGF